jgi:predicted transcriptional regulator
MNALWSLNQGTVRDIQQIMAPVLPRAYTTIMTIMDRLARKGVVARLKQGRAYLYRPNLSAEDARGHAVEQVVDGFFDGSAEALSAHLSGTHGVPRQTAPRVVAMPSRPASSVERPKAPVPTVEPPQQAQEPAEPPAPKLDTTLL